MSACIVHGKGAKFTIGGTLPNSNVLWLELAYSFTALIVLVEDSHTDQL